MRIRKITAVLLSLMMITTLTGVAAAAETDTELNESAIDQDQTASVISAELDETAAELESLTPDEDYVDGEGVFLADTEEKALSVAEEYGGELKSYSHGVAVISFPGSTVDALQSAAADSEVSTYVDPNYMVYVDDVSEEKPNDPFASESSIGYQYFHDRINTLKAHKISEGKGVKIAVIDIGCAPDHEDSPFDKDHAQVIASLSGNNPSNRLEGHGIHTTGIIHEIKGNSLGGYGMAPEAEVYSIKISGLRSFPISRLAEGFAMALEDKVNVINMSLGANSPTFTLQQLVDKAYDSGITVVAAAGNEGHSAYHYPAAFDHVISVAAVDKDGNLASYSNYGDWVDVAAPGSKIISTFLPLTKNTISGNTFTNSYGTQNGTSMAAPMVAGIAALCYGANPEFLSAGNHTVPDAVTNIILSTTDEKTYSYNGHSVTGMVQADSAVETAKYYHENSSYLMLDDAGIHGSTLRENIAKGKSVKLYISDINGNKVKKGEKEATWASSDSSILTVKNGKVKCSKNAAVGSKVTVTATMGSDTMTCLFTVTEPLIDAGYAVGIYDGGKHIKIKKTIYTDASIGMTIDLTNPYIIYNDELPYIYLVYSKKENRVADGTWAHAADNRYNYRIGIKKSKLKKVTVETGPDGKMRRLTFNEKGTYPIKFTAIDGSGKSFTYKIKVT